MFCFVRSLDDASCDMCESNYLDASCNMCVQPLDDASCVMCAEWQMCWNYLSLEHCSIVWLLDCVAVRLESLFICVCVVCGVTAWAGRFRRVGDSSKFDQLWLQLRGWILVYFILLHLCLPLGGYHYLLVGQGTGEHHNDISPI